MSAISNNLKFVPIRLDDCNPPAIMKDLLYIDLYGFGIDEAILKLKDLGYKSKKLNVSGAFHSSYLKNASDELFSVLKEVEFKEPNKKIIFNTVGKTSDEDVKILLKNQIKSSVKFMQSVEFMIENGIDTFVEIGPGKVLSGLVKQINPDVNINIYPVESLESIRKVVELLHE